MTISDYFFDWGDGNTTDNGTDPTADHTYTEPGTYTVTVTVTNAFGQDTAQYDVTVFDSEGGDQGFEEYWDVLVGTSSDAVDTATSGDMSLPDLTDTDDFADESAAGVILGWTGSDWGPLSALDGGSP